MASAKATKAKKPRSKRAPARRSYHHGNLREALIVATSQLIEERGPAAVTVRDAAQRAGVSSGAPFRHFPNRESLLTAVAEEAQRRFRAEIERALAKLGKDADPLQRFHALGVAYLQWAFDNPAHFEVISSRREFEYDGSDALLRDNQELIALGANQLREAQRLGLLGSHDLQLALLSGRALVYGLARMYGDGHLPRWGVPEREAKQVCTNALGFFIAAIAAPKTTPRRRKRVPK